ncbi:MAG: hypothetical protein ACKVE4_00535 [Dissulfuribacterales bacterium]
MLSEKIVDFHVHLFPDKLFDAIWNHFSHAYKWEVIHHLYYADLVFNLGKECLEQNKDKILYGSDFPNLIYPRKDEINCLLDFGLSEEFYQKIFLKTE